MRIWNKLGGRLSLMMSAAMLVACGGGGNGNASSAAAAPTMSAQAELGDKIFNDPSLSGSGKQSCASCHDPSLSHSPPNALAAQLGGPHLDQQGRRSSPSTNYLSFNAEFRFAADGKPSGGFFWDGRAASLQVQAAGPFTNPDEMANDDVPAVIARLAQAAYADEFKRVFGADIFTRPDDAMHSLTLALSQYQKEDVDYHAFSSKFDEVLLGRALLTEQEARGLAVFNDPARGNCIACHPSAMRADGGNPLFTDFSYHNLGVPRNPAIQRNADASYFDLGLCERADLAARKDLCGSFKVPSLRNVAKRQVFFHNGRFTSLKDVLTFYAQRDTHPEKWYPRDADGSVRKFDDLPAAYMGNIDTTDAPLNRKLGQAPAMSDADIDDVIAFLRTLSDGFVTR